MSRTALPWHGAWRIAMRDFGLSFKGLRLLLVCLFLGVGALAAIGSLTASIERELGTRGRTILGGDLEVSVWQRKLDGEELAALEAEGRVSGGTRMQAMARAGDAAVPIELKAVDAAWPLVGRVALTDGRRTGAPPAGTAWLSQGAADRLGIGQGADFEIGTRALRVGGIVADEPDRLGEGFALGPTIIVAESFPEQAGLIGPGAMYRSKYRIAFDAPRDPGPVGEALKRQFPSAGFEIRDRDRAAPGAERFVTRMGEFLVLVGLAALVIAGIGIGGGVNSYLEARRGTIATLKVLGATSRDILRIYTLQIGTAALVGSLAGLAAGVLVTPLLGLALSGLLPVDTELRVAPAALAVALAYGMLVTLVFAATPLLRARLFPAMALMRARIAPLAGEWRTTALPVGLGLAAIVALAVFTASRPLLSAGFLAGAGVTLVLLAWLGLAIRWTAHRLPHPRNMVLRQALANLHRPGAQTVGLVSALGFGLTAFVALAAIETSIAGNIAHRVPERAPDYFVLDIPRDRIAGFTDAVRMESATAEIRTVPMLRGAILAYGPRDAMVRVADLKELPEGAWPLRGERGLTYADAVPEGNTLTEGEWWPADYAGEPLVSVDEELARVLDLRLGDRLTVGILGVEREARIASFRRIDWDSMGFNFVLVFSPNALADAPHNLAATVDLPPTAPAGPLLRKLAQEFPSISVIEVGGVLKEARTILDQVGTAVLASASVAVLAGLAVLLGAIAASRAARAYDTVVLRVLGASKRQILLMQLAEYGLLAAILALVALALGSVIAWAVVTRLFEFTWLPDWANVVGVLAIGLAALLAFALAGSAPLLRARPAQTLREL